MDLSSLLILLLICGGGNNNRGMCQGQCYNHCHDHDHCHDHCHDHDHYHNHCGVMNTQCCQEEEPESTCPCKDNGGMIPPPWVRVDDGKDTASCGCNKR